MEKQNFANPAKALNKTYRFFRAPVAGLALPQAAANPAAVFCFPSSPSFSPLIPIPKLAPTPSRGQSRGRFLFSAKPLFFVPYTHSKTCTHPRPRPIPRPFFVFRQAPLFRPLYPFQNLHYPRPRPIQRPVFYPPAPHFLLSAAPSGPSCAPYEKFVIFFTKTPSKHL